MVDAKDTFYIMLRDRIAALNPARIMNLRGVLRPGVLVEENELATDNTPLDVFRLRWTALQVETDNPLPAVRMTCEIRYATEGNSGNGGMDRGRLLSQMDTKLSAALQALPQSSVKMNYAAKGATPLAMATRIFWNDAAFDAPTVIAGRLERRATVEVFSYQEAGE